LVTCTETWALETWCCTTVVEVVELEPVWCVVVDVGMVDVELEGDELRNTKKDVPTKSTSSSTTIGSEGW
jgi:hypothetical protein